MKKTPNYIKKTLDEAKLELLKDNKLQLSRQLYAQKLKEIFAKGVIDLKDNLETKLSSTGTDKTIAVTNTDVSEIRSKQKLEKSKNQKVIF